MKKLIVILCALILTCAAVSALADQLYKANMPDTLKALIAGKSFKASITGWEMTGEDEDTKITLSVTVCERDEFDAAVIENLAEHDILFFGNGMGTVVKEAAADEFGVTVKDFQDDCYFFTKTEAGTYTATTETEYPFWTEVFTIKAPLEKDISFLDWSDPENLEAPVKRDYDAFIDLLQEGTNFSPYNTKVTFDENGKLVEFLYSYSPWN